MASFAGRPPSTHPLIHHILRIAIPIANDKDVDIGEMAMIVTGYLQLLGWRGLGALVFGGFSLLFLGLFRWMLMSWVDIKTWKLIHFVQKAKEGDDLFWDLFSFFVVLFFSTSFI